MPSVNLSKEMYEVIEKYKELRKCETVGEAAMRLLRMGITRYNATATYAEGQTLPTPEALPRKGGAEPKAEPKEPKAAKKLTGKEVAKLPKVKAAIEKVKADKKAAKGPLARKMKGSSEDKPPRVRKPKAEQTQPETSVAQSEAAA
jgi:hypothetical protein